MEQELRFCEEFINQLKEAPLARPINYHGANLELMLTKENPSAVKVNEAKRLKAVSKAEPAPQSMQGKEIEEKAEEAVKEEEFEIKVKPLKGAEHRVNVRKSETVLKLKETLEAMGGYPVNAQRLMLKGKALLNTKTIGEYDLVAGSVVNLIEKSPEALEKEKDKDFFKELESSLRETLTEEQTKAFIAKFKAEYQTMIEGWNLEEIDTVCEDILAAKKQ